MIIGVIIRYVKTYSGINYIPLTDGHQYCGLLGNNGIGKSSILEAFDCFFNKKKWNLNIVTKKSGLNTTNPYIVPIFLVEKTKIKDTIKSEVEMISTYAWGCVASDFTGRNIRLFETFKSQRDILERDGFKATHYLLPIGYSYEYKPNLSFFKNHTFETKFKETFTEGDLEDSLQSVVDKLASSFEYIYIPKDINPEDFTQLETEEIQKLMGETLHDIVAKCVPRNKIDEINRELNTFIDSLSKTLGEYSFRTGGERQVNLRKHDVYKLIIEAYFNIRKLHKKRGDYWLDLNSLSSGEKQKAIMELAYHFLKDYRKDTSNLIIAIDEPEASLHMSACYDQFNKLAEMGELCSQLIFTTHWYGFIPTVEDGCVSVITKNEKEEHQFDLIRISSYRESIKQSISNSKGKLPYDIRLKSINDFTQSIITSILADEPYNWLICEGTSEKIYFNKYLEDIIENKKLRIIPVGGATEIKRVYSNLKVAYEDFKKDIKGKVILISDTDSELVQYPVDNNLKKLKCFRIVNTNVNEGVELIKVDSNPVSPKTEIEDALDGKQFYDTLMDFKEEIPSLKKLMDKIEFEDNNSTSYFSLNLSPSQQSKLENIFDENNLKFRFAKQYVEKMGEGYKTPKWINKLKKMY